MEIGDLTPENGFVMAPVKTGYGDADGQVTARLRDFSARRADHVGAITPEPLALDPTLRELPNQLRIDSEEAIAGLSTLTETMQDGDAAAIAHLNHPGRMANAGIEGTVQQSASATPCERTGITPERMDDAFLEAAAYLDVALYPVGDTEAVGKAQDAIASGFDVVRTL